MNRIEIKCDGPVEVYFNGNRMTGIDAPPDRITVDMTEREAELVRGVCSRVLGSGWREHTFEIYHALAVSGVASTGYSSFEGDVRSTSDDEPPTGYAHAERVHDIYLGGCKDPNRIRLTMDRDVAVTLNNLICCVRPRRELDSVLGKLCDEGAFRNAQQPRFTGTIRWKKKLISTGATEVGKTYKLVSGPRNMGGSVERRRW